MTAGVRHIRRPLGRNNGTQWYKDRRDPAARAATYCGGDLTDKDTNCRPSKAERALPDMCVPCLTAWSADRRQALLK